MAMDIGASVKITAYVAGQAQVDALNRSLQQTGQTGEISAKQTAAAFRTLPAQFTDIATQLAGGQNPLLVLLQQGGQIKDSFGGFGNMFRNLASLITPVRVAVAGVVGVLAAMGKAAYDADAQFKAFNQTIALTGNIARVSYAEFGSLAAGLERSSRMTIGASKELINAAMGTGVFGRETLEPAIRVMAQMKDISDQSSEDIVKDFANMASGVAQWAAAHNKSMGFITAEQFEYIKSLEQSGNTQAAMRVTLNLLGQELARRAPEVGAFASAWDAVKKNVSGAMSAIGEFLAGPGAKKAGTINPTEASSEEERRRVQRKADGTEDKLRMANDESLTLSVKKNTDERIGALVREQQAIDQQHQLANISNAEYYTKAIANKNAQIDAEIALEKRRRDEIANRPKGNEVEEAAKANRIQQAENAIAALEDKKRTEQHRLELEARTTAEENMRARLAATLQIGVINVEAAADARIAAIQREQFALDEARGKQLISQAEYVRKSGELNEKEVQQEIIKAKAKLDAAKAQPAYGEAAIAQKAVTIANMQADVDRVTAKLTNTSAKAASETATALNTASKALRDYKISLQNQNDLLELQLKEVDMTADAYRRLVLQMQRKQEIESRARANPAEAEAIRAIGAAASEKADQLQAQIDAQKLNPQNGVKTAFKNYTAEINDAAKQTEKVWSNALKNTEDALVDLATTGKFSFKDLASSIIKDLIRIQIQQSIMKPLTSFLQTGASVIAKALGAPSPNANGNAFDGGNVIPFASGGVVSSPQLFPMSGGRTGLMGEAGPEAVMPLRRNAAGVLGVVAQGGGGDTTINNVTVNVDANGGTTTDADNQSASLLGALISKTVQSELVRQKRPGGLLYEAA